MKFRQLLKIFLKQLTQKELTQLPSFFHLILINLQAKKQTPKLYRFLLDRAFLEGGHQDILHLCPNPPCRYSKEGIKAYRKFAAFCKALRTDFKQLEEIEDKSLSYVDALIVVCDAYQLYRGYRSKSKDKFVEKIYSLIENNCSRNTLRQTLQLYIEANRHSKKYFSLLLLAVDHTFHTIDECFNLVEQHVVSYLPELRTRLIACAENLYPTKTNLEKAKIFAQIAESTQTDPASILLKIFAHQFAHHCESNQDQAFTIINGVNLIFCAANTYFSHDISALHTQAHSFLELFSEVNIHDDHQVADLLAKLEAKQDYFDKKNPHQFFFQLLLAMRDDMPKTVALRTTPAPKQLSARGSSSGSLITHLPRLQLPTLGGVEAPLRPRQFELSQSARAVKMMLLPPPAAKPSPKENPSSLSMSPG